MNEIPKRCSIHHFLLAILLIAWKSAIAGDVQVYPALPDHQYGSDLYTVTVAQAGKRLPDLRQHPRRAVMRADSDIDGVRH